MSSLAECRVVAKVIFSLLKSWVSNILVSDRMWSSLSNSLVVARLTLCCSPPDPVCPGNCSRPGCSCSTSDLGRRPSRQSPSWPVSGRAWRSGAECSVVRSGVWCAVQCGVQCSVQYGVQCSAVCSMVRSKVCSVMHAAPPAGGRRRASSTTARRRGTMSG
jgi:hypothetical protein